jgi:uncharacterized membrane protein (UPF0182 family)
MRTPQDFPRRAPRVSRRTRGIVVGALVAVIVAVVILRALAGFWINYLWFSSVGFTSVFRGVLLTKVVLAAIFVTIFFVVMMASLTVASRLAPTELDPGQANELVVRYRELAWSRGRQIRLAVSIVFALLAGVGTDREWNNWDLFHYAVSFGVSDPQFHRDVGFYVFRLPFIEFLIGWAFEAVIVVLIVTAVFHYLGGSILPQARHQRVSPGAKAHLSVLLGLLAIVRAVGYYYDRLALVLSRSHVVDGATNTSVHANAPADFILMAIAVIAAALFLANIRQRGWVLPAVGVALWGLVSLLIGVAYPAIYQALRVNPSELTREATYIQRNIDATRAAYGLSKIKVHDSYDYSPTVTTSEIQGTSQPQSQVNQQTIANIRLLDPQVDLLNAFNKYQALRSYYSFDQLSVDRYVMSLNGDPPQETGTLSAVRELNSSVPSGFVNQKLVYTHGYGAVVAPIGEAGVSPGGEPAFTLQGLPPQGQPSLDTAKGAEIYYGLGPDTGGYVIADSKTPEVDYENAAGQQITGHYAGDGGVPAGSLLRRAAFASYFGDANFLLSGQITPSSRVMFIRNVTARVQKAAPFLKLDSDPYAVILNNQVYWIIDAYTVSDNYPYSQNANLDGLPANSGLQTTFNYVRNSVKVVVSAYNGSMKFYAWDPNDPILRVYMRAFPDLFTPASKAPADLVAHFRYPEDLFQVQTNMYGRYHLTDASDFYSQAQAWAVSPDPGSGPLSDTSFASGGVGANGLVSAPSVPRLPPQYELASLPGSSRPEENFLLVTPFVPISATGSSQNLTAIMTASSDPGSYGELNVYPLPAGTTVDGPGLISNLIRANQQISTELTLYNQQGSQVELGEVAVVPIDDTLLYVEPVYVESTATHVPTLDDVVVVYNGKAYHSGNASIDNALCQITNPDGSKPFSNYCNTAAAQSTAPVTTATPGGSGSGSSTTTTVPQRGVTVQSLLAQASADFASAQKALQAGNLGTYQADVQQAQQAVQKAQQMAGRPPGG